MYWFLKYIFSKVISFILLPIYLFPINKNKVTFISYGGMQYSCNPKYISEHLQYYYKEKYKLVWIFKKPEDFSFLDPSILKVRYLSFMHFYHIITSKVCITNMGFNRFFWARSGQRFVQTWHGGGAYKRGGKSLDRNFFQNLLNRQHDRLITDFISSSQYSTKYVIGDFLFNNTVLEIGMPRNAFLLKNKDSLFLQEQIKRRVDLNYTSNKLYILYAPTWRDDNSSYEFPDFMGIIDILGRTTNKEVVILFRSHHFHTVKSEVQDKSSIDVTNYPDMQELLLISDILISDYSSSIWDFSLLYKPCFLYTPDLAKYENGRGFYVDIREWGFDICKTSDELKYAIHNFELSSYKEKIKKMHEKFGSFENTESSEKLLFNLGLHHI